MKPHTEPATQASAAQEFPTQGFATREFAIQGLATQERCLCATVRRAGRVLNRRYEEALRPAGMSSSQYELMKTLDLAGPSSQQRLVRLMEADQTTLSRNLKLLIEERWIERITDGKDARRRVYRLTKLGAAVLDAAHNQWRQAQQEMERRLGLQLPELWTALDRILLAAREPSPGAS